MAIFVNKHSHMKIETIAIKNTRGQQAINIPKQMEINDDKVYLKKWVMLCISYHFTTRGKT